MRLLPLWAALALVSTAGPRAFADRFPVGVLEPVSGRVTAEASRLGLSVEARAPEGAAVVPAGRLVGGAEVMADWRTLRLLTARAVAQGASGVYLRLPAAPAGHDLLDYPEEWQAAARAARELLAMRRVLEGGAPAGVPFAVPDGVAARAWSFEGRRYVLLVNPSAAPRALSSSALEPWRALFEVRSDARQVLAVCGAQRCLRPGDVLWLEGRPRL